MADCDTDLTDYYSSYANMYSIVPTISTIGLYRSVSNYVLIVSSAAEPKWVTSQAISWHGAETLLEFCHHHKVAREPVETRWFQASLKRFYGVYTSLGALHKVSNYLFLTL